MGLNRLAPLLFAVGVTAGIVILLHMLGGRASGRADRHRVLARLGCACSSGRRRRETAVAGDLDLPEHLARGDTGFGPHFARRASGGGAL